MKLTTYDQKYENDVVALWNQELPEDPITVHKFRHQALLDDNFDSDLCYVALENEKVIGFLLATRRKFPYLERGTEPDRGWVNVMFVSKEWQRKGIGSIMLKRAEQDMKSRGAKNITLAAYSPSYFFPGVDIENYAASAAFFETHGYQKGKISYSMCKDLHGYQLSEETQHDRAEDCILLVLDKEDRICGFCTRMIDENPMRFGPIGTAARVRNQGLGSILFDLAQLEMEKRGIYHLYFVSTDDPGRRFYERHGVHVFRTFADYRKDI